MGSKFWIKLYHEVLHDPKMARLPDRLYRRAIECFLFAGELDNEGELPSVADMAWILRADPAELEAELAALAAVGIVEEAEGAWLVSKFAERQAAASDAKRMREMRRRRKQEQYYGGDDVTQRNRYVTVTLRNTDKIRGDKIRGDKSRGEGAAPPVIYPVSLPQAEGILCTIAGFAALPNPSQNLERLEQIVDMIGLHGEEGAREALEQAFERWVNTKAKSGKPYQAINLGWVDWAIEALANHKPRVEPEAERAKAKAEARKLIEHAKKQGGG